MYSQTGMRAFFVWFKTADRQYSKFTTGKHPVLGCSCDSVATLPVGIIYPVDCVSTLGKTNINNTVVSKLFHFFLILCQFTTQRHNNIKKQHVKPYSTTDKASTITGITAGLGPHIGTNMYLYCGRIYSFFPIVGNNVFSY